MLQQSISNLAICSGSGALHSIHHAVSQRGLSVLSWGRNTEHQCGIEGHQPLITQPTAVLELLQQPVSALVAGRNNSAAVVNDQVYAWGEGTCGKLGLGSGESAASPSRIEAFVGRSSIAAVSLGQHHSLFLDREGHLWAAGENKEGQCGLGTPLAELARQHRQAYDDAMRRTLLHQHHRASSDKYARHLRAAAAAATAATAAAGGAGGHVAHGWGSLQDNSWRRHPAADWGSAGGDSAGFGSSSSAGRGRSWLSTPWDRHGSGSRGGAGMFLGTGHSSIGPIANWGGNDLQAHMQALQMQPGQTHTPARVGCGETHMMLLDQQQATQQQGMDLSEGSSGSNGSSSSSSNDSLSDEVVVGMAAGKYFSVAVTAKGEVWTFGACYNGALGSGEGSSWQTNATRVSAPISGAIAARGGAVAVAAGSTFSAALASSGEVLLWGKLVTNSNSKVAGSGTHTPADPSSSSSAAATAAGSPDSRDKDCSKVQLPEGVHITHIAAGQQHLLMSDGERVWAVGRWMDAAGHEAGCAPLASPAELLALPGSGIVKLEAGMHSSAVVDADGQLWVWGRLLDQSQAQAMVHHGVVLPVGGSSLPAAAAAVMQAADATRRLGQVDWGWAGFGGEVPRVVQGLQGVRDVALGGWHALVLVD